MYLQHSSQRFRQRSQCRTWNRLEREKRAEKPRRFLLQLSWTKFYSKRCYRRGAWRGKWTHVAAYVHLRRRQRRRVDVPRVVPSRRFYASRNVAFPLRTVHVLSRVVHACWLSFFFSCMYRLCLRWKSTSEIKKKKKKMPLSCALKYHRSVPAQASLYMSSHETRLQLMSFVTTWLSVLFLFIMTWTLHHRVIKPDAQFWVVICANFIA